MPSPSSRFTPIFVVEEASFESAFAVDELSDASGFGVGALVIGTAASAEGVFSDSGCVEGETAFDWTSGGDGES